MQKVVWALWDGHDSETNYKLSKGWVGTSIGPPLILVFNLSMMGLLQGKPCLAGIYRYNPTLNEMYGFAVALYKMIQDVIYSSVLTKYFALV